MGLLSTVSSVAETGASMVSTVMSMGKSALSIGKSIIGSKSGRLGLGVFAIMATCRNNPTVAKTGDSILGYAKSFFGAIGTSVRNIVGGIAGKALDIGHNLGNAIANHDKPMVSTEETTYSTETSAVETPVVETPAVTETATETAEITI